MKVYAKCPGCGNVQLTTDQEEDVICDNCNGVYFCDDKCILVEKHRLISPSEYAKKIGKSKARVTQQMDLKQVEVIEYDGGRLIYLPEK